MGGMGGMGGMPPGMGGMGQPGMGGGAPVDTRPPKEKYASELAQIKEMGFTDEDTILQLLQQSQGNVNIVMERGAQPILHLTASSKKH